jgi:hypothetical protein
MRMIAGRVLLGSVLAITAAGCDWGMERGDAARTGGIYEATIGVDNVEDLRQAWVVDTGESAPAGPVTASGAVIVVAGDRVLGYQAGTGALRWDTPLPPSPIDFGPRRWRRPATKGGTVFIGYDDPLTSGGSHGGYVRVDAVTGGVISGCCTTDPAAVTSSLSFVGDDIWYGAAYVEPLAIGSYAGIEGRLATGQLVRAVTSTSGHPGAAGDPAVADGVAYFARPGGGFLDAIDATGTDSCTDFGSFVNCTPLWSASVAGAPRVAVSGSTVYATTSSGISAYATGDDVRGPDQPPLWQAAVPGPTPVAVTGSGPGDTVLVGSSDGSLRAYAAGGCGAPTCSVTWQAETGGPLTAPVVANDVVYVGSTDGYVYAFAAAGCGATTCEPLWAAQTPSTPTALIVANGRVFATTTTGDLVAYQLP